MSSEELGNAETLPGSGDDAPASATRLAPGTVLLDRYRIDRWLGAGGMGAVYAAHDTRLDQRVALKFVAGARSEVERERLRAEVRTLQGLTHRGIARTFTFDEADGEPFIVMELLDGETLSARIARGALDEPEARAVIGALAAALDEAHRAGVVHRDVKPANVMLCPGGRVVLMDFGLARSDEAPAPAGPSRSVLMTTSLKGTPAYLAPEMALGRRVDARADLYSLGVVAYEALAGKLPFEADSAKGMIDQHVERVPDEIRARRPEISAPLSSLIARLLAKDPEQRPASAAEVLAALAPRRRRRWPWLVAVAVAVVAACAVVFVMTRGSSPDKPSSKADWSAIRKLDPEMTAQAQSEFDRAQAAYEAGNYADAIAGWQRTYAIAAEPSFLFNIAAAAQMAGDRATALLYYKRYLSLGERVTPDERERIERQIAALERAPDAGPERADEDAGALYDRATAAYNADDFVTAIDLYMRAYALQPAPAFLYNMGQSARRANRPTQARFYYQQYLQLNPKTTPKVRAQVEQWLRELDALPTP